MKEIITSETIKDFFRKDLFAGFVGIELIAAGEGRARAKLEIRNHHLNGLGLVHGGAIFALADLAFATAVNSRGRDAVAIHCSISYLKAVTDGSLFAEAEEVSCGPKIATYTIRITDASGELISCFEGMAFRKTDKRS